MTLHLTQDAKIQIGSIILYTCPDYCHMLKNVSLSLLLKTNQECCSNPQCTCTGDSLCWCILLKTSQLFKPHFSLCMSFSTTIDDTNNFKLPVMAIKRHWIYSEQKHWSKVMVFNLYSIDSGHEHLTQNFWNVQYRIEWNRNCWNTLSYVLFYKLLETASQPLLFY